MEGCIVWHLTSLSDGGLATSCDAEREHGETRLGHGVVALQHTLHHPGALSLLPVQTGDEEGNWEVGAPGWTKPSRIGRSALRRSRAT